MTSWWFYFHFPNGYNTMEHLLHADRFYIFFEEMSIQAFCLFFNWVGFLLSCMHFLYILNARPLSDTWSQI